MVKILLCCAAGMSTSMVVNKMRLAASEQGLAAEINAVGQDEFDHVIEDYDCCLLGPQIRYRLNDFKARGDQLGKPVALINSMDYGTMRGEKILAAAMALLEK